MDQPHSEPPASTQDASKEAVPLDAQGLVRWCVALLAASAWQAMGLIPNPATHKIERNLDEARMAIDASAALIELLTPKLADQERRDLGALLTDLRINFVEQQAKNQP